MLLTDWKIYIFGTAITIIVLIAITTILLLFFSPGKIEKYRDKAGRVIQNSIAEKCFVTIGGLKQGMIIKGKNINNPVLLYVHGGPAFPNYFLIDKYSPGLEDNFTICYWEQRGGGLSYSNDVTIESMNLEQFTIDTIEVSNYLRKRFGKEKIYLMAHSGGTSFSIQAASRMPQLYYAYIGMAQITNQNESEKLAYKYIMEKYNSENNQGRINQLKKYSSMDSNSEVIEFYSSAIRDQAMHELGIGTMRSMHSIFLDIFIPVWRCKAYTLSEKVNLWKSKFFFVRKSRLIKDMFELNIPEKITDLKIPVFFFSGKFDMTVNTELSEKYLNQIKAPIKGFYTFENSAHSPIYEEPEKIKLILSEDVLKNQVKLADK